MFFNKCENCIHYIFLQYCQHTACKYEPIPTINTNKVLSQEEFKEIIEKIKNETGI